MEAVLLLERVLDGVIKLKAADPTFSEFTNCSRLIILNIVPIILPRKSKRRITRRSNDVEYINLTLAQTIIENYFLTTKIRYFRKQRIFPRNKNFLHRVSASFSVSFLSLFRFCFF